MAHMIGHNIGMSHDDGRTCFFLNLSSHNFHSAPQNFRNWLLILRVFFGFCHQSGEECICRDWHGCIMAQSIVGLENVQPYKFSECSKNDYIDLLRVSHGGCMMNKPNEVSTKKHQIPIDRNFLKIDFDSMIIHQLEIERRNCGNKIVEDDEECDCGTSEECENDPCCDSITCKLKTEAECADGLCCDNCKVSWILFKLLFISYIEWELDCLFDPQLRPRGIICRDSRNECDIPEYCTGDSGQCPKDVYKKNGQSCGQQKSALGEIIGEWISFLIIRGRKTKNRKVKSNKNHDFNGKCLLRFLFVASFFPDFIRN